MAHILAKIGWPVVQLDGGYKNYRHHVNDSLPGIAPLVQWRVICGTTGSGKTRLLQTLADQGAQILDLEELAAHRGSVLGHLPSQAQPSQKMFESKIWQALRKMDFARPVFVESESKKVGNLRVPDDIINTMRASPCIALELPLPQRVALLMDEYSHFVNDSEALNTRLDCLVSMYGKEKIQQWKDLANQENMVELVTELLAKHYDPAYLKSINKNFPHSANALNLIQDDISYAAFEDSAKEILRQIH
jgi:tRNA 2-selenouridine synthase